MDICPLPWGNQFTSTVMNVGRFVSCLAFLCDPNHPEGLLVSGSGDSTVSNNKQLKIKFQDLLDGLCLF